MVKRPDANLVKGISKFTELMFHIMHGRNESAIYYEHEMNLGKTLKYLEDVNKDIKERKDQLTLFHIILCAAVRTIAFKPQMNRFVSGRRLWQRNRIVFSFVVKKELTEKGEEVNAKIEFDPFDTLKTVKKIVNAEIYEARYGKNKNEADIKLFGALPRWLTKFIFWFIRWNDKHNRVFYSITKKNPIWGTAFIANLGSLGMDVCYHHLYELGNISLFLVLGKIKKVARVNQETEKIEIRNVMKIKMTIDERTNEGIYLGNTIDLLQKYIENPELLEKPPKLSDKQLDKLMLEKYKENRSKREKLEN